MPAFRTDGAGGGYQVPSIPAPNGVDGDFRLLDLRAVYTRVMLEDDEGIAAAAEGWNALGQALFVQGQQLKHLMTTLSDSWQSEAATLMAERVEAAVASFDRWSQIAIGRSYEMFDLAAFVSAKKLVLEDIWRDFHEDAGKLLTPPANLTLEQRTQWRDEAAGAPALHENLEHHTVRALDMVVNPLANRYAEAALAFATPGPVYAGPVNAAIPSDEAIAAMTTGRWVPEMPPVPTFPGRPAAPAVPDLPAAPSVAVLSAVFSAIPALPAPPAPAVLAGVVRGSAAAPAVPSNALGEPGSAPAVPQVPAGALSSLLAGGWAGAPDLAGRRAPVVPAAPSAPAVPAAPGVLGAPGVPGSPGVPGGPGVRAAAPPAVPAASRSAAAPPGIPGRYGPSAAASATAPHLPDGLGLPASPARRPGLPGRTVTSAPRSAAPPAPPSLPGSTRPRAESAEVPGTRATGRSTGTTRAAAPAAPHLLGREGSPTAPPAAPSPPPSLGAPRSRADRPTRSGPPARSVPRHGSGVVDPAIPAALRSARTTGTVELPTPAVHRAATADPRLSGAAPSGPAAPVSGPGATPTNRTSDGRTPDGRTLAERAADGRVPGERTADGRVPGERTVGGRTSAGRAPGGRHRAADAGVTRTNQHDGAGQTATAGRPERAVGPARTAGSGAAEVRELGGRPAVPTAKHQRKPSGERGHATTVRPGTHELTGRVTAAPTRAEERAAERARRRAEWTEARRRHEVSLSR